MLFRLALLNLSRNFRRTALSLGSVIAGVAVLILGQGFIGGLEENIIRAQVDSISGHVMLRPAEYPTEGMQHPVDKLVPLTDALKAELDANGKWAERLYFSPRAVYKADAMRVRAIAIGPRDADVFPRNQWQLEGKLAETKEDGVTVSAGVARLLQVGVGDDITLEARTHKGSLNADSVKVAGIVRVGAPLIDRLGILVPWELAEDLVRNEGQASHISSRIANRNESEAVATKLEAVAGSASEAVTWQDETAAMMRIQDIRRAALNFVVLALMGMSASGIANTVLMAAYERIREVGTLRALGMTEGGVLQLFLIEGALMGMVGGLTGALIGGSIVLYFSINGIDLTSLIEQSGSNNLPVSAMLYLQFSLPVIAFAIAFGVVVAVGASVYPARVASRMVPADAVRAA